MNVLFALRRTRYVHRLLRALDFPLPVRLEGIGFPVYVSSMRNISFIISHLSIFESDERRNFRILLDALDVRNFWDVGANIGIYGFTALSQRPASRIVLVEPDLYNCELLRKTLRCNRLDQVILVNKACSETVGFIRFYVDDLTGSTGSIVKSISGKTFTEQYYNAEVHDIVVETTTLDTMLQEFGSPDLVKIDVEGAELQVLVGSTRTLTEARPAIMFESDPENCAAVRILKNASYVLFDMTTLRSIEMLVFNNLAVPEEKAEAVRSLFLLDALPETATNG